MRDRFGREITYLRLSVTDLCNLRCLYCMPEEGVCKRDHAAMLTEDDIITDAGVFRQVLLYIICLSPTNQEA